MAQNTTITLAPAIWIQITNADVTGRITFQNVGASPVKFKATIMAAQPMDDIGAFTFMPGQGSEGRTLQEIWPGLSGADRLYAYAAEGGRVAISHE